MHTDNTSIETEHFSKEIGEIEWGDVFSSHQKTNLSRNFKMELFWKAALALTIWGRLKDARS